MNTPIQNIISAIQDGSQARIKLTLAGGNQQHFDCVFREDHDSNSHFFLSFEQDALPDSINHESEHPVSVLEEEKNISLNVTIAAQTDSQTLRVLAESTLDPSSLRKYFRVNVSTEITASFKTSSQASAQSSWTAKGHTMDLSASGVLTLLNEEPKHNEHIIVEIFLPPDKITVNAVSHVVHKKRLRKGRWLVAFHFDTISTKHRDAIITYLLAEQRRQLRENIRTESSY